MTAAGKKRRLMRIIPASGRTVIVPVDHGTEAYYEQLTDMEKLVAGICEGRPDALLLRRGAIERAQSSVGPETGLIYRINGTTGTEQISLTDQKQLSSVEEALRYDADAVIYTVTAGHPSEGGMFMDFARMVEEAHRFNLPVIGEADVFDSAHADAWKEVRRISRAMSEEGADVVKAYFPGNASNFRKIVDYCLVPVIAAGGPKMERPEQVLQFVRDIVDAGCAGPCIGRNIWQFERPGRMIEAIGAIARKDATVKEAASML